MRLINTASLKLEEFFSEVPEYAILSHTWGTGEVSFQDWANLDEARRKDGYAKIEGGCRQAIKDGIKYLWVDTNCIDKTSSSELSEAINSMFSYYSEAKVCYVYLADVSIPDGAAATARCSTDPALQAAFRRSRWFTRGWTLQELLAPSALVFFSREWRDIGTKASERGLITSISGIDSDYLRQPKKIKSASVARRMSWMANRTTTRVEDIAYCMLGIFDINMALLYGEGTKAFLRLQEEIIKVSNDQTIFCWQKGHHSDRGRAGSSSSSPLVPSDWLSVLAPHPVVFRGSGQFFSEPSASAASSATSASAHRSTAAKPYSITNFGLSIDVPLLHTAAGACAILDCGIRTERRRTLSRVMVRLHRVPGSPENHYVRLFTDLLLVTPVPSALVGSRTQIFVDCRNARPRGADGLISTKLGSPQIGLDSCQGRVLLLAFNAPVDVERAPAAAAAAPGVDFHSLDSAVELSHDVSGRFGIRLQGRVASSAPFVVLVAGERLGDDIRWLVDVSIGPAPPGAELSMKSLLAGLDPAAFGTWIPSPSLRSVASWPYSERGAIFCVLELDLVEAVLRREASVDDSLDFQHLSRSTSSLDRPSLRSGSTGLDMADT